MKTGPKPKPLAERFWSKVDKRGPDECWEWQANIVKGYGYISVGTHREPKSAYAHRVSWEIHNGPIPPRLCVCHKCDNPICVNPAHLFLGTVAENNADMRMKGRHYVLPPNHNPNPRKGIHVGGKVTPEMSQQIRHDYTTKDVTQIELAEAYRVSKGTVYYILRGEHYTVQGLPDLVVQLGRHTKRWRMTKYNRSRE